MTVVFYSQLCTSCSTGYPITSEGSWTFNQLLSRSSFFPLLLSAIILKREEDYLLMKLLFSLLLWYILIERSSDAFLMNSKSFQISRSQLFDLLEEKSVDLSQGKTKFNIIPFKESLYSPSWRLSESFNSTTIKTILNFQDDVMSFFTKIEYSISSFRLLITSKVERDIRATFAVKEYVTRKVKSDIQEVITFQQKIQKPLLSLPAKIQQLSSNKEERELWLRGVDRSAESQLITGLREKTTKERAQKLRATKQASLKTEEKIEGVLDLYQTIKVLPKRLEYDYQRRVRRGETITDRIKQDFPTIDDTVVMSKISPEVVKILPEPRQSISLDAPLAVTPQQSEAVQVVEEERELTDVISTTSDSENPSIIDADSQRRIDQFLFFLNNEAKEANLAVRHMQNFTSFLLLNLRREDSPARLFFQRLSSSSLFLLSDIAYIAEVEKQCSAYLARSSSLLTEMPSEPSDFVSASLTSIIEMIRLIEVAQKEVALIAEMLQRKWTSSEPDRTEAVTPEERDFLSGFLARYSLMTSPTSVQALSESWEEHFFFLRDSQSEEQRGAAPSSSLLSESLEARWFAWKERQTTLEAPNTKTILSIPSSVTLNDISTESRTIKDDEDIIDATMPGDSTMIDSLPPISSATSASSATEVAILETTAEVKEVAERRYLLLFISCLDVTFFLLETLFKTLISLVGEKREVVWQRFAQTYDISSSTSSTSIAIDEIVLAVMSWLLPSSNPIRKQLWLTTYMKNRNAMEGERKGNDNKKVLDESEENNGKEWQLMGYFQRITPSS